MQNSSSRPWTWIPSLHFIGGIPYILVTSIATMLFKRLGMDNADITFFTGWLFLPWVIRPLWIPIVRCFRSHRWWIIASQLIIGICLASAAFSLKAPHACQWVLACFWLTAFCNAIHDTASQVYYSSILPLEEQNKYLGVSSKSYALSLVTGQGITLMAVGILEIYFRQIVPAWRVILVILSLGMVLSSVYHAYILPSQQNTEKYRPFTAYARAAISLMSEKKVLISLLLILLYNVPKALLSKTSLLFLIDNVSQGGMGLSLPQIGFGQGTIGIAGWVIGGIIGKNILLSGAFHRWKWMMALSLVIPNCVYIYMSLWHPTHFGIVCTLLFAEQLGYGFGMAAFTRHVMGFVSHDTCGQERYDICSAWLALGIMLPNIFSGYLQTSMGYPVFLIVVTFTGILTLLLTYFVRDNASLHVNSNHINQQQS